MPGVFVTDPGLTYPAGAPDMLPLGTGTWHGRLHALAGATAFFSLPLAIGLSRRVVIITYFAWMSLLARHSAAVGIAEAVVFAPLPAVPA
jgi:hypothetical protein